MYTDGNGVPQDYVQAHMWFNRAQALSPGMATITATYGGRSDSMDFTVTPLN